MFIGFDRTTLKAQWTCNIHPGDQSGHIVIETDDATVNLMDIQLEIIGEDEYKIIPREYDVDDLIRQADVKRRGLLAHAKHHIELLTDVMELGDDSSVKPKLDAWRSYRVAVYNVNPKMPKDIVWPVQPKA